MKKPLKTTKDRAAVLARLTESQRGMQAGAGERGQQPAIAVKILTAIPAGDSSQKSATLMTRNGGTLQETGQTVLVRHVGEGAVSAGAIVTPEPCGRLGLCFTRSVQVVRQAVVQHRPVRLVGPIAGELGTEDTDWEWGTYRQYPYGSQQLGGWFASVDFTELPPVTAPNVTADYVLKMKPLRFEVHGYAGQYCGGQRFQSAQLSSTMSLWARERLANYGTSDNAPGGFFGIGLQNTIAETFHFSPASASTIQLTSDGLVAAAANRLGMGLSYSTTIAITNYRIRANGANITGIVSGSFSNTTPLPIPLANYAGQTLQFDVWITVTVKVFVQGAYTPEVRQVAFARSDANFMPVRLFNEQYNLNGLDQSTRFNLAFDSNGPEGVSSLLMDTSSTTGWTVSAASSANQLSIYKTISGQLNTITLSWGFETPTLKWVVGSPAFGPEYKPRDNSKFDGLLFANGSQRKIGTWDSSVSTQFDLLGSLDPFAQSYDIAKSGTDPAGTQRDAYYATQPQTITVTKV